jgi:hypothetical protein
MTENDKNDLKVPRLDILDKPLSRDTRIKELCIGCPLKVWDERCCSLPDTLQYPAGQPFIYALNTKKITKKTPVFFKMVDSVIHQGCFSSSIFDFVRSSCF